MRLADRVLPNRGARRARSGGSGKVALDPRLASRLLRWYMRHRRALPWRRTRDPYRVWVAEVMLQQTRVETVVPYYLRFLQAFPDVRALASARQQDVLQAWAGLGYYARARNLLRAARKIVRTGHLPTTAAGWRRLPGIGPYTAAAVASIAFGQDVVALDGNVLRVGVRLLGLQKPSTAPAVRRSVEEALRAVLPPGRAGEFNQALMDLGATTCLPSNPKCGVCPVRPFCAAHALGLAGELPRRPPPRPRPRRRFVAALVRDRRGRVLLVRQPSEGVWGGLWTFPYVEAPSWPRARPALRRLVGVRLERDGTCWSFEHAFTHFRAHFRVHVARPDSSPRRGRFVPPEQPGLPVPAPVRRLLARLGQERQQRE
ncbi:MAG: A/G-specific adenine glycosylase [Armatimonadota bacterium]|nr:A/G-specific adenine glycosylase [Armatimonadota bacterium]